jgi:hypothetical protein
MYFKSQLEDAIGFQWGSSKHDETMAASLCIAAAHDAHEIQVKAKVKNKRRVPIYRKNPRTGIMEFS